MDVDFEVTWKNTVSSLSKQFDADMDIQGILFLIGIQELNGRKNGFSKDEKIDLIHIAICRLLSKWGYYENGGNDKDGWPHWRATQKLPNLSPAQQLQLMKEAIIEYFDEE